MRLINTSAAWAIAASDIGGRAAGRGSNAGNAAPAPTVTITMIQHDPGSTATVTVTPTANAQGEATQISADGVYVVGQDIPGGTWHTSGGQQCYEVGRLRKLSFGSRERGIDTSNGRGR
jgi:hypothetical protein